MKAVKPQFVVKIQHFEKYLKIDLSRSGQKHFSLYLLQMSEVFAAFVQTFMSGNVHSNININKESQMLTISKFEFLHVQKSSLDANATH